MGDGEWHSHHIDIFIAVNPKYNQQLKKQNKTMIIILKYKKPKKIMLQK